MVNPSRFPYVREHYGYMFIFHTFKQLSTFSFHMLDDYLKHKAFIISRYPDISDDGIEVYVLFSNYIKVVKRMAQILDQKSGENLCLEKQTFGGARRIYLNSKLLLKNLTKN